jgi:hypothetical protein
MISCGPAAALACRNSESISGREPSFVSDVVCTCSCARTNTPCQGLGCPPCRTVRGWDPCEPARCKRQLEFKLGSARSRFKWTVGVQHGVRTRRRCTADCVRFFGRRRPPSRRARSHPSPARGLRNGRRARDARCRSKLPVHVDAHWHWHATSRAEPRRSSRTLH